MTREAQIVMLARSWLGTPYRHQASVAGVGADCLGLVRGVYRGLLGHEPCRTPQYSMDWGECGGGELLLAAARQWLVERPTPGPEIGDVILFRMRDGAVAKHLGIVSAVGAAPAFVHAYTGHGVVESPLSAPWLRRVVAAFAFPEGAE